MTTGGLLKIGTRTEAQGYAPDWLALEEHFPKIKGMLDYAEKWAYIEERCRESDEDAEFVRKHRPKIANSHRVVVNKCVTDDFCEDIVDVLCADAGKLALFDDYKFHHWGTGVGAEDATDAALGTPGTESRVSGTASEASSKVYQNVATITCNATGKAITEHGVFNASTSGILMDRTKFGAINVVEGNQVQFTFTMAFTSGN